MWLPDRCFMNPLHVPPSLSYQLFIDKDTLVGALNATHDLHMLAIDSKEDKIASRVQQDLAVLLKSLQEEELARSRKRVVEIEQYVEQQKEEEVERNEPSS